MVRYIYLILVIFLLGDSPIPRNHTIPLKRAGNLLLMEGKIGEVYGNFIFDTGASELVLNSLYFKGGGTVRGMASHSATSGQAEVRRKKINKLELSGLVFENVYADIVNLGHLESSKGVKIIGLFGLKYLKEYELHINLGMQTMQLYPIDKDGIVLDKPSHENQYHFTQKFKLIRNNVFVKANIAGRSLTFCLDTGAETNVIDNRAPGKVLETVKISRRAKLRGVGNQVTEVLFGKLSDFNMEGHNLNNMNTLIANLNSLGKAYGVPIHGMLGYDFLAKGLVCINMEKKEISVCFNEEGGQE